MEDNHEDLINSELAGLLRQLRRGLWDDVSSNPLGYLPSGRRPDIVAKVGPYQHVVIENEVGKNPEKDAVSRLREFWWKGGPPVVAVIALRTPIRFRKIHPEKVPDELSQAHDLECFVLSGENRWPKSGFVPFSLHGLAELVDHVSKPLSAIDDAVKTLTQAIRNAGAIFYAEKNLAIADALHQKVGSQTWRMAGSIVANALMFQDSLAGFTSDESQHRAIKSVLQISRDGVYPPEDVIGEWEHILKINYYPIFAIARDIIKPLDPQEAANILGILAHAALRIRGMGASGASDFTGLVFQRLITDRKFLATFYTLPASAELLAGLAIDKEGNFPLKPGANGETAPDYSIADFACGTGGLLVAAAHRISNIYAEKHGVDRDELQKLMMEKIIFGADVFPSALHLSASLLSSMRPKVTYEGTRLNEMPYGKTPLHKVALGSLEILSAQSVVTMTVKHHGGQSPEESMQTQSIGHKEFFNLVIMNPPFTRNTGQEAEKIGIPNPAFAGFGNSKEEQRKMSQVLPKLIQSKEALTDHLSAHHGNAGIASAFLDIADLKLKESGILAFVLPLTFTSGAAWEKSRTLIRKRYDNIRIVTIAAPKPRLQSFSADTGMGECLLIAKRANVNKNREKRILSINLTRRPATSLEGAVFAGQIKKVIGRGNGIRRIEDGPVGATTVLLGAEVIGSITDIPIPESGSWGLAGVSDTEIAQVAYAMEKHGKFCLRGSGEDIEADIPIALTGEFSERGPHTLDISRNNQDGTPRGPYDILPLVPGRKPSRPCLSAHHYEKETCMEVQPDTEAVLKSSKGGSALAALKEKDKKVWATASRVHWNLDFGFNSQSTNVVMTAAKVIGEMAWPSVIFHNEAHEKAFTIWHNTTPGLLLRWWNSSRQQAGRGRTTVSTVPTVPSLDVRKLSKAQLQTADKIFDEMKTKPMLSFHRLNKDKVRHELDRRVLVEMLGLPESICTENGPLQLLRNKLAAEPSIHGGRDN